MRYVRTKDGKILEITEKGCIKQFGDVLYVFIDKKTAHHQFNGDEVYSQANTIDELCDCYLEDWGKGVPCIIAKTRWVDLHKEKSLRKETTFYACIIKRNEKGVHIEPVAKLNEKGDFKLL